MSDHGNNIDYIVDHSIGKMESKNPFLTVMVPEKLRSNENLMEHLNKNSQQILTHFDLYATFLEIVEVRIFILKRCFF